PAAPEHEPRAVGVHAPVRTRRGARELEVVGDRREEVGGRGVLSFAGGGRGERGCGRGETEREQGETEEMHGGAVREGRRWGGGSRPHEGGRGHPRPRGAGALDPRGDGVSARRPRRRTTPGRATRGCP